MVEEKKMKKGFQQTEVGLIPNDWKTESLKDLSERIMVGIASAATHAYRKKGIVLLRNQNIKNGYLKDDDILYVSEEYEKTFSNKRLKEGDLITARTGYPGATCIIPPKYEGAQSFTTLITRPNNQFVVSQYLNHFINSEIGQKFFTANQIGGSQKNVNAGTLKKLIVAFPPTKAEQTAIATALSDMDALIEGLEKLLVKKRNIKQGAMQELLRPKEGWVEKELGKIATLKARIGWQGLTTKEYKETGDFFLITGTEFKNGFIDWDKCHYVDYDRYKQDKNIQVKPHDVLVTKDGTIGKVALIKSVPKPATLNSGVFVIRPIDNSFHPEFFYYLLLSNVFLTFLSQLSAGSTINHLYQKDFVTFKFFTPKSIEEQTEIAKNLYEMDEEIEQLEAQLSKYKLLKTGMMQELLTGKKTTYLMYQIDKEHNKINRLEEKTFSELGLKEREHLQEWIAKDPSCLGEELLIIQKEFDGFQETRERLDLLALDKQGNLVIIENKLDDSGRDVTWQVLKYASYCSSLSKEDIRSIFQQYLKRFR